MPGTDDIRRLSDELAREPASLAFITLAGLLQARGEREAAWRLVERGSRRHPRNIAALSLFARLAAERGMWDEALLALDAVATLSADAAEISRARQTQAFLCYRCDRLGDADRYLDAAAAAGGDAAAISAARSRIRERLGDPDGRALFDALLEEGDLTALLVAADGLVTAGRCEAVDGRDVSAAVAAELSVVGDQATRAMRHLALGSWQTIVVEATDAMFAMTPVADGLALVATASSTPVGRLRRLLDRVSERARAWGRAA